MHIQYIMFSVKFKVRSVPRPMTGTRHRDLCQGQMSVRSVTMSGIVRSGQRSGPLSVRFGPLLY